MGAVFFSIDPRLVWALTKAVPLDVFVETGTFRGDTLAVVKDCFREIYSIELSPKYFEGTEQRFTAEPHIQLMLGESASLLRDVVTKSGDKPTLFFLDAHWCVAEHSAEGASQCPLLEELQAIGTLNADSVVVIDDARLFLCTPPPPHEASQWPVFGDVLRNLTALSAEHELMVVNDYIVFYPLRIREAINSYARQFGVDWLYVFTSNNEKDNELETLKRVCAERDEELNAKESEIETLKARVEELKDKKEELKAKKDELASKRAILVETQEHLVEKEEAIRELSRTIRRYRLSRSGFNFLRRPIQAVHYLTTPKLGKLHHHPPIPLRIPAPYICASRTEDPQTISVVTPSFQQALFLERTMESVLSQGYESLEYLVQDGGSDDGTVELLERYSGRLHGFESASDRGQAHAINRGFAKTSGEIMCWLNSDDLLLPGTLACVGDYFTHHPEVDVVYGNRVLIDQNDMEIGRWILPPHDNKVLSWADFIPQETLFWRRSVWEKAGGYVDEDFNFALDWDLLLRFRDVGARFVRLPRLLGAFRVHESQKTSADIHDTGFEEMARLRKRYTGLDNIDELRLRKAIAPYLIRHVVHDLGWRVHRRLVPDKAFGTGRGR